MKCKSIQTFCMVNEWWSGFNQSNYSSKGIILNASYVCVGCEGTSSYDFLIKVSENLDFIMKVGQYPAWDIKVDKNMHKILGSHLDVFKKGLINESQGYGIGAYAYYRRIVENIIDELLEGIRELIDDDNIANYDEALERTKKTKNASDKIDIIKDMLPPILRPNNMNPLRLLYSNLSEGLHSLSDEDCLEKAEDLRDILLFLVRQIVAHKEYSKNFTQSMKKIIKSK